jgi:hypothetical protein
MLRTRASHALLFARSVIRGLLSGLMALAAIAFCTKKIVLVGGERPKEEVHCQVKTHPREGVYGDVVLVLVLLNFL